MIKGLLSVLLVLVAVTSALGKPEKGATTTKPEKKEKRVPQTLSRGECSFLPSFFIDSIDD